ncbi:TRAP transporter permease [Desulfosporosinus sp. BICA1-9]|uniref:TRAP transporter permease n=1 Tax=Desulfosporosinus sp. BICA1-9 TaxID=1531958 RepID=UPI0005F22E66|nr:TRAP transporter permease [Desulfosporosinus sp. BICA1-9]KJS46132.1 MAG: hypothetical protein VR66_27150 [Peptococcaceae bacterium BRH_c23]KJS83723.1 MAG: hypothetical protein JL57_22315 [Desulfosporosinus sp. BICA1-9]HBW33929.1 C4-dicarboxylate ABC transporter [Desulfosporosinus sp.]
MSSEQPVEQISWLRALLREGRRRNLEGPFRWLVIILAIGLTIFEVWLGGFGTLDPYQYTTIFYPIMLAIAFLYFSATEKAKGNKPTWLDIFFSLLALGIELYFFLNIEQYLQRIPLFNPLTPIETVIGIILVLLSLEVTRRVLGPTMTLLVLAFMGYTFFGDLLPGAYSHRHITLNHFLDNIIYTVNGLFGTPIAVAATYVFLFVLFGSLYTQAGGGDFFFKFAASIAGRSTGGPAKIAIISAGLFGMISGSPTSDVVTTGSVNIPMMKKVGFNPIFAGAVESAASTGGSILPPIMGSAAFLMAEFAGIPYRDIAVAAVLPALLYYLGIYLQIHFRAEKNGMMRMADEDVQDIWTVLKEGWIYIIPLVFLVYLIIRGFTPSYVAVMASGLVVLLSWFTPERRIGLRRLIEASEETVQRMIAVTVACAAAGMLIDGVMLTGLGTKFGALIFGMTGGSIFFTLLATAILCIILGMGMPVSSAYIITAVLAAPILIKLGLPTMSTHLFIVYYSCLSAITPPVAVAAYAASSIADANPIKIGLSASKMAFVGFILPFMFVYQPALILQAGIISIILAMITAIIGVIALASSVEGWIIGNALKNWERAIMMVMGLAMVYPGWISDLIGLVVFVMVLMPKVRNNRASLVNKQSEPL